MAARFALALLPAPLILPGCGVQIAVDPPRRRTLAWIQAPCFLLACSTHVAMNWVCALRFRPLEGMMEP